ncbi:methyltransferase [Nocardia sp. NPDC057227]|uniref:methyltransferase n=1 Tax=Nocardia sp. NPDC057227 TaxID=3346056 RepID=UPI003644F560
MVSDFDDATAVRFLIYGRLVSEAICTFADLGCPELIGDSGCTAGALSEQTGTVPDRLDDLLRLLAAFGLVRTVDDGTVRLTERGEYLRADRPGSALPTALLVRGVVGHAWDGLESTLRTGAPAFDSADGRSFFDEIDRNPSMRAIFDDSQARGLDLDLAAITAVVRSRDCGRIVDIGGGDGYLVAELLTLLPRHTGVVIDRPVAVGRARARMSAAGLSGRCVCAVGDFTTALDLEPRADDLMIMRHICHDWSDEVCVRILSNCRSAMTTGARLAVVEHYRGEQPPVSDDDRMAAIMGLYMATVTSGRERTIAEYEKLHATAGLAVIAVTRFGGSCLIESVAAG